MKIVHISDLPTPPKNCLGFPWTVASDGTPQYISKNLPKISIITPSFNQGMFIEETIRSILLQNYPNLEFIIIDGGSTDETVDIIKKYDKWIAYWVSERDNGQSDAINKGLKQATGVFFNWINSDDLLSPNALWAIAKALIDMPSATAIVGYLGYFKFERHLEWAFRISIFDSELEQTLFFGSMAQPALFLHTETVKLLTGVDERLHFCMDLELWCRYLTTFGLQNIAKTDEILAYFRIQEKAKSSQGIKPYLERIVFLQELLRSLNVSEFWIQKLNLPNTNSSYIKVLNLSKPFVNREKFIAYLIEYILTIPAYDFPLKKSLLLWFFSFSILPLGRRTYFFSLLLRLVYRKNKKSLQR